MIKTIRAQGSSVKKKKKESEAASGEDSTKENEGDMFSIQSTIPGEEGVRGGKNCLPNNV